MNSRERVLTAISRKEPDRVPVYLWLTPHLIDRLEKERGVKNYEEYLKMDIRFVDYKAKPEVFVLTSLSLIIPAVVLIGLLMA